jgi:hypothetical protein
VDIFSLLNIAFSSEVSNASRHYDDENHAQFVLLSPLYKGQNISPPVKNIRSIFFNYQYTQLAVSVTVIEWAVIVN